MAYSRKDVEKTKMNAKKFVRYQEGAEKYSIFICMTAMFVKLLENERLRILSILMCFSFITIWLS